MRRVAAAVALSLAVLLAGGAASAQAGPGVLIRQGAHSGTQPVFGDQIAGAADAGGTYKLSDLPGQPPRSVTLHGVSMRSLLVLAGFNPRAITFVRVVGADGNAITLTGPQVNNPPFPDGPAIVTDEGPTTRFVKPSTSGGGTAESVLSVPGTPLEMTIDGGSLLSIKASASPARGKVGQTVTFRASVSFPPPSATLTYSWDFGDGASGDGAVVTHRYTLSGDFTPRITVRASGGTCSPVCEGTETVDVTITGQRRSDPLGTVQGGGGATSLGGTGNGGSGSGTGSGNGNDLSAFGGYAPKPKRQPPPQRAQRPEPHERFSADPQSGAGKTIVEGVLLAGAGIPIEGALSRGTPGGSPKPQKGTAGTPADPSRIGVALMLCAAIMSMGALRERRRVRLRVA